MKDPHLQLDIISIMGATQRNDCKQEKHEERR